MLFGFWHGMQFLLVPSFRHWHVALMTDVSWAGEIQTKILSYLGYVVVRGSSKRQGVQALIHMKRALSNGHCGGFALDGPRGPIHKSKPGILVLAQKLQYPIIPTTVSVDRKWVFKNTWCQYVLPKPFSRCYVAMGPPIWPMGSTKTDTLDRLMNQFSEKADIRMMRLLG